MVSLTCKQVQGLKIRYDDIVLDNVAISKVMLCGIVLSYR